MVVLGAPVRFFGQTFLVGSGGKALYLQYLQI